MAEEVCGGNRRIPNQSRCISGQNDRWRKGMTAEVCKGNGGMLKQSRCISGQHDGGSGNDGRRKGLAEAVFRKVCKLIFGLGVNKSIFLLKKNYSKNE